MRSAPLRRFRRFARDESGAISVWALLLFMSAAMLGGFAVDVMQLNSARTELQVTADSVARAAVIRRKREATAREAATDAIRVARFSMPAGTYGSLVENADFAWGTYDARADIFRVDSGSRQAVLVTLGREERRGNAVSTLLLRMAAIDRIDISVAAVAVSEVPACLTEGFAANGVVDTRSNNLWRNGFCMHSNKHVAVNSNSVFEPGVIVSMPDLDDFVIPASGFQQNQGLQRALRESSYPLPILEMIRPTGTTPFETAILTAGHDLRPDYLQTAAIRPVSADNLQPSHFVAGQVHRHSCAPGGTINFKPAGGGPTVYSRFVLITDCDIVFDGRVDLEDVLIYTTSTSEQSIKSSSGGGSAFNIGRADACGAGGGAQIVTRGGVRSSARITLNGGQIVALRDVQFAAQGGGGFGASIISDAGISGTSNLDFGGRGGRGMEGNLSLPSYRLAR